MKGFVAVAPVIMLVRALRILALRRGVVRRVTYSWNGGYARDLNMCGLRVFHMPMLSVRVFDACIATVMVVAAKARLGSYVTFRDIDCGTAMVHGAPMVP